VPRYNAYGEFDDTPIEEIEVGFKGFNNRLRPDQLPAGVLANSENGRVDITGEWQTRFGISLDLAPFTTPAFTLPFYLYANTNSSGVSRVGDVITIDFAAPHGFTTSTLANISGITGITPDPNGNRIITVTDPDSITITVTGLSGTIAGTATVGSPWLDDDATSEVFGAVDFYDDSASNQAYIILAGNSSAIAVNLKTLAQTTIDYPTSRVVSGEVEMKQFINQLYMFQDGLTSLVWDGDLTGSPAFTEVANGDYLGASASLDATNNTTIVAGLASVDAAAHGLVTGDEIIVVDPGTGGLLRDDVFTITRVDANSLTFNVDVEDEAAHTVKYLPPASRSLGYSYMPAPPWAIPHQNRLVCPFNYTTTGTSGSAVITDREVRDELIFSRIFRPNQFDHIYAQFKFNSGKSDYIVAAHSFSNDQLVVLNRESIYVISDSIDIKTSSQNLITPDLGCVARQTVLKVGDKLMFLSDNGVYALNFQDLYNLRGQDMPLSESINETMARINKDYAHKAEAVYHDNRYYLAVALDDATENNHLLIYNFLNKEWESIDYVNSPTWNYRRMLVAGDGDQRGVYTVNSRGGVHRIDGALDAYDNVVTQIGGSPIKLAVEGDMTTRSITGGSIERKKWKSYDLHIESSENNTSNAILTAITENIDGIIALGTLLDINGGASLAAGEDISLRRRFGNPRAYGIQFRLQTTEGRPKVRAIKFNGHQTFNSTTNAE
jgi:hypothetical protein